MAQQNNAQTIALQLEKVRDKVPLLYERDDVLLSMIQQRGDIEKVSSRNMRLPLQLVPGGKAGSYSADGGDLGLGSGTSTMSRKSRRSFSGSPCRLPSSSNTRPTRGRRPSKMP